MVCFLQGVGGLGLERWPLAATFAGAWDVFRKRWPPVNGITGRKDCAQTKGLIGMTTKRHSYMSGVIEVGLLELAAMQLAGSCGVLGGWLDGLRCAHA
jgi:hypothetical protein